MINGYPEGSNITMLNVSYYRPNDFNENDYIAITYKDLDTNEKKIEIIDNPDFEYYALKPDASDSTIESISYPGSFYRDKSDYKVVTTPYRDLTQSIAKNVGESQLFYNNLKVKGGYNQNKKYFKNHYKVESTDHHISDFYMKKFRENYINKPYEISKAYIDIETDGMYGSQVGLPIPEESPINAISFVFENENKVFSLLLRDSNNPLIEEFEKEVSSNPTKVLEELKLEINGCIKDISRIPSYGFDKFEYNFGFFDEEIDLIATAFDLQRLYEPDFVLAWNMAFDIPYIIRRIEVLGYDPAQIMCDKDSSTKFVRYYIDERHKNDPNLKSDECIISSKSVFLDQLIQFSAINSTKISTFGNWKLDNIGRIVAKMGKVEFDGPFRQFPYTNYKKFVFYNIIDTLVQCAIEKQSKNIDHVFNKCLNNSTRYSKLHKQSIYLNNNIRNNLFENGKIMCTNRKDFVKHDQDDDDDDNEGYPGAFVADPTMINNYCKVNVNGHPVNLFDNSFDFDYKGLYPHTCRQFNIGHEVMIGKVVVNKDVKIDPKLSYKYYDVGSNFVSLAQSESYLEIGEKYLSLSNVSDMMDYINSNI